MNKQSAGDSDSKPKWAWVAWSCAALLTIAAACQSYRWIAASGFDIARVTLAGICWQVALGVCGILFVYLQIRKMAKNSRQQLIWNKRVESLKKITEHREITESFVSIKKYRPGHANGSDGSLESIPANIDGEELTHVWEILNYFETIEAGIKYQVYDDAIMYSSFRGMALDVFCCAEKFIRAKRLEMENPNAWILFEGMVDRWKSKHKEIEAKAAEAIKAAKDHDKVEDIMQDGS